MSASELADKIEGLQDDGSEGYPWSQEELDLIISALRALDSDNAASRVWTELSTLVSCTSPDGSAELDQVRYLQERLRCYESDDKRRANRGRPLLRTVRVERRVRCQCQQQERTMKSEMKKKAAIR